MVSQCHVKHEGLVFIEEYDVIVEYDKNGHILKQYISNYVRTRNKK